MKFIRDIISEKRSAKPDSTPFPLPDGDDDSFQELAIPDQFDAPDADVGRAFAQPEQLPEPLIATSETNIFAPEVSPMVEDQHFDSVLNAWVNADESDGIDDGYDPNPVSVESEPMQAAPVTVEHPAPQGTLYLDSGSLRALKGGSPFDKLKNLESGRNDAISWKTTDAPVREPSEEKRLRHAMTAYDRAEAEPTPPTFSIVPSAPPTHVAEPANQRPLSEMPFVSVQQPARPEEILTDAGLQVPPPAAGRGSNRSGRVKTRLLGFNPESMGMASPFEKESSRADDGFPVAWLVVVAGPGRGASFALHDGVSRVGRGEDQSVCLNFGDNSISRENHISIAYDSEQNSFFVGQSGRSNIVRLNNKPLLSTEQVRNGDQIRVGETTLRLVAVCGENFSWAANA
ncbi:MAG: FHA domain-containing protein [Paracoccaceae bacterium]